MIFPVFMYGYESWTMKKAEQWRIDAFELWCSGRLLRVPWTTRKSNQSVLKEISPEYSLERLMLKLKLGHLMRRANSLEKTLMLGKVEGKRRRSWEEMRMVRYHHWLNGHEFNKFWELLNDRGTWCAAIHKVINSQTQFCDWITTKTLTALHT